jgi:hypothetical protein
MRMRQNNNWAYLPDYSSQNHTLKFSRKSCGFDSYHSLKDDDKIPPGAIFGGIAFVLAMGVLLLLGHDAGF